MGGKVRLPGKKIASCTLLPFSDNSASIFFSRTYAYTMCTHTYTYTSIYSSSLRIPFPLFPPFPFPSALLSIPIFPLFFPFSALLLQFHSILPQSSNFFAEFYTLICVIQFYHSLESGIRS